MNHHASISAPQPVSRMEGSLTEVDCRVDDLLNTVDMLRNRLEAALLPGGPASEGSAGDTARSKSAPLIERLDNVAARVYRGNSELLDLLNRLAL